MISFFPVAAAGFGLGMSLIVAIGAQNAFVLRQGIKREHVVPIVLICAGSDAALIMLGIGGLGAILELVPGVLSPVRWAGAAFLFGYGLMAARRACRSRGIAHERAGASLSRGSSAVVPCADLR